MQVHFWWWKEKKHVEKTKKFLEKYVWLNFWFNCTISFKIFKVYLSGSIYIQFKKNRDSQNDKRKNGNGEKSRGKRAANKLHFKNNPIRKINDGMNSLFYTTFLSTLFGCKVSWSVWFKGINRVMLQLKYPIYVHLWE